MRQSVNLSGILKNSQNNHQNNQLSTIER